MHVVGGLVGVIVRRMFVGGGRGCSIRCVGGVGRSLFEGEDGVVVVVGACCLRRQ